MNTCLNRKALISAAFVALMAAVFAFAAFAPAFAYADESYLAEVGYIDGSGNKIQTGTCNSISEINNAINSNSASGKGGAYVQFCSDWKVKIGEKITVTTGKKATVYLAGHVVDGSAVPFIPMLSDLSSGFVCDGGTLVVSGDKASTSGEDQAVSTVHAGYIAGTKGDGKFWKLGSSSSKESEQITGSLITGFQVSPVRTTRSGSNITCKNVTFAGNQYMSSIYINRYNCKLELQQSVLKWNQTQSGLGGAITVMGSSGGYQHYVHHDNIVLDNSSIQENIAGNGGGIYVKLAYRVSISLKNASRINGNYAETNGGGIFFDTHSDYANGLRDDSVYSDVSSISLSGGSEICNNTANSGSGGAVYGYVENIKDGEGVSTRGARSITLEDKSKISGNTAANGSGGGLFLRYDERTDSPQYPYMQVILRGESEISKNTAQRGGGIYATGTAWQQVTLNRGSHIDFNTSTEGNGAGIYTTTSRMDISLSAKSTINNNTAHESGGGIFNDKSLTMQLDGASQVNGNKALTSEGGGIDSWGSASTNIQMFNGSQISGNTAYTRGGGLAFSCTGESSIGYDETSDDYSDQELGVGTISYNAVLATDRATKGGGIYCETTATLRNIEVYHNSCDSEQSSGGGLAVENCGVSVINCSVSDNEVKGAAGGGIEIKSTGSAARTFLGGVVKVEGNKNGSGDAADVHLGEKTSSKSDVENDNNLLNNRISESTVLRMSDGSRVGLQRWTGTDASRQPVSVKTEQIEAKASYFFSDDPSWSVNKENNVVWLVSTPTEFTLNVKDDLKVTAQQTFSYGETVTIDSNDYDIDHDAPTYWTLSKANGTASDSTENFFPDADGKVTFTMPGYDAVLTSHRKAHVKQVSVNATDSNAYSNEGNGLAVSVPSLTITDSNGVDHKLSASDYGERVSGARSFVGAFPVYDYCRIYDYEITIDASVASELGLNVTSSFGGSMAMTLLDDSTRDLPNVRAERTSDGGIRLKCRATLASYSEKTYSLVQNCVNVNNGKSIKSSISSMAKGVEWSWDASQLGGAWEFVSWETPLPSGWEADESTVTNSAVGADATIAAQYKPVILKVDVTIPDLHVGEAFPTSVTSYKVADALGVRDVTDLVNQGVSLKWAKPDGSDAGDTVAADTQYRVTITTNNLAEEGYQYGVLDYMVNSEDSISVVLNGSTVNVCCIGSSGWETVVGYESAKDSSSFDELLTSFPTTRLYHAAACQDEIVKIAHYRLKNGTVKSALISWDFSGIDDALSSGEFTVKGTFTDEEGNKHEVSQAFYLADLNPPTVNSIGDVFDGPQDVTIKLDDSFNDVDDAQIWYCVTDYGKTPSSSDYQLYNGQFTVDSTEDTTHRLVYTYAQVGERKTQTNLYSYVIEKKHTVAFDSAGGTAVDSQQVVDGATASQPEAPTLDGFVFAGWCTADGQGYDFSTPVKEDLVLHARWRKTVEPTASYLVAFDSAGGSAVGSQALAVGELVTKPADPTLPGCEFAGWYTEDGSEYDFSSPVAGSFVLHARWSKAVDPAMACTVAFDSAGGSDVAAQAVATGAVATEPAKPTREGCEFAGWYTSDGVAYDFSLPVTGDLVLHARWSGSSDPEASCMVVFDSAGGSAVAAQTVSIGGLATQPDQPVLAGFEFAGWFTAGGEAYNFSSPVKADLVLHARWYRAAESGAAHTVAFDTAGGTAVANQQVADGGNATEPAAPTFDGYEFAGWFAADGEFYDFSSPVTSDVVLYACWYRAAEPGAAHTVVFDTAGGEAVANQQVGDGDKAAKPADPVRDGYEFAGWHLADGDEYDFTSSVTADLVLHARWKTAAEPVAAHTVTFDSAGGSAVAAQTVADGDVAVKPADPIRDGYAFAGWYTADGGKYDFSTAVTADITLYAHWSAGGDPAVARTVIFDSAGGSAVESQTVADGGKASKPADPTRDGYTFQGWFTEDGDEYDFDTPVTEDVVLVAKWAQNSQIVDKPTGSTSSTGFSALKSVKTGDAVPLILVASALAVSLAAISATLHRRRNRKQTHTS